MGQEVPKKRTSVSLIEMAKPVLKLGPRVFSGLTGDGARILLAHLAFETGSGKLMFNFNPGNISAGGIRGGKEFFSWPGDFRRPGWFNKPGSKLHTQMLKGQAPSAFRAYSSLDEGVQHYMALINRRTALKGPLLAGNPNAFAVGIKTSGYTPGIDTKAVGNTLTRLVKKFQTQNLFDSLPQTPGEFGTATASQILPALAVTGVAVFIFWRTTRGVK